jgi:hypothetical protein
VPARRESDQCSRAEKCAKRRTVSAARHRFAYCTALIYCIGFFFYATAVAQISPGPLSRPHQVLNGSTNCAACLTFGGQAVLKCLACHTEIASRLTAHRGLHATYNIPTNSSQESLRCSQQF